VTPFDAGSTRSPDASVWLLGLATVVWALVVDQGTKLWAAHAGAGGVEIAHNPRYALGIVGGAPAPVMVLGTAAVLTVFAIVVVPMAHRFAVPAWIPGLVLGGALSNMVDRVRFGAVRDFISTGWAIVNVADLCVVAGVAMLPMLLAMRAWRTARGPRAISRTA
jgi:signal peptidase II